MRTRSDRTRTAGFVVSSWAAAAPRHRPQPAEISVRRGPSPVFACGAQVTDDSFVKEAVCTSIETRQERGACLQELADERSGQPALSGSARYTSGRVPVPSAKDATTRYRPAMFDNPKARRTRTRTFR